MKFPWRLVHADFGDLYGFRNNEFLWVLGGVPVWDTRKSAQAYSDYAKKEFGKMLRPVPWPVTGAV